MDMVFQMMQKAMPQEGHEAYETYQRVSELQQAIVAQAKGNTVEMLNAIRPMVPTHNWHKVDIMIKCFELSMLLSERRAPGRKL